MTIFRHNASRSTRGEESRPAVQPVRFTAGAPVSEGGFHWVEHPASEYSAVGSLARAARGLDTQARYNGDRELAMPGQIRWPEKSREIQNHHMDSTFWNGFEFRDDDIIVATYAKAGTTWVQQILAQLLFNGRDDLPVADMSPWVDLRVPPREVKLPQIAAQTHRRFLKTHLPVDALVFSPRAKYLYIGRDGRDVIWSLYNHHANANELWYQALNDTPGRVGPPIGKPPADVRQYFREWLDGDGYPLWSFWENVRTWWDIRGLPNVKFVHFQRLKDDLPGSMRDIAAFLGIPIDETKWDEIVRHCTFDYMKRNATPSTPLGGAFWEGGAETFIHKGTNGRWRDVLSPPESARYERIAAEQLGPECARWLATGKLPDQSAAPPFLTHCGGNA